MVWTRRASGSQSRVVTAPRDAELTSRRYLRNKPGAAGGAGGVHAARRRASSSHDTQVDGAGAASMRICHRPAPAPAARRPPPRVHMADDKAVAAAGKAAVGNQRHLVAQALAHDGAGRTQHFAHAGPALRTFVAQHQDVAGHDGAVEYGLQGFLF